MLQDSKNGLMPGNSLSTNDNNGLFNFTSVFSKIFQYRWLFVISVILCLSVSYWYTRYSSLDWHIYSKIMVDDSKNSTATSGAGAFNSDISSLFNVKSNADNELQILKSRSLAESVVKKMQLNVKTYVKQGFRKVELSDEFPYKIDLKYNKDTLQNQVFLIEVVNSDTYKISNNSDNKTWTSRIGQPVELGQYTLRLNFWRPGKANQKYYLSIESIDVATFQFIKSLSAVLSDKQATAIDISINYPNPKKGEAILNEFMNLYLLNNLEKKVLIADSTIKFINARIDVVGRELNAVEQKVEDYKQKENIVNITEQSKNLVSSSSEYYDKLNQQEIQLSIINDLEQYLNNPQNKKIIPSSLTLQSSTTFGQSVNAYNELLISRDRAELAYTDGHPVIQNLDVQINSARLSLLKNIETYRKSTIVVLNQLKKQNGTLNGALKQMPSKERFYLDLSRQQNLKQELYLYLLQKREETAISKTSTISSSTVIDYAKSDYLPYKPNNPLIYLIGVIIGILIPGSYLLAKEALGIKINSKSSITNGTSVNILGEIIHSNENKTLISAENSRSVLSEHFRSFRTNLKFVLDNSQSNVILFTSSMGGEGKSFLSLNLGSSLAITGKRVVFVELDLRKPKLSESIGISNDFGYTNYAVARDDDNFDINTILKRSWFNENCYIVSSGPIPPNPAELLSNERTKNLIETLKKQFDYVIIDCAPVGLVADALLLEGYSDLTLYVVRQNFTYKSQLEIINELIETNKVRKMYLVVNDINFQNGDYSGHKQNHGYGNYIEEKKESHWWKKIVGKS